VEEKTAGLAWHYRAADPEYGAAQAGDLLLHLATLLSNAPAEVLTGDHVVEIRPAGREQGTGGSGGGRPRPARQPGGRARGRPHRRGSLRRAPAGSISVHVGPAASRAELRVRNVTEARAFLRGLLEP
jgi:trehalose 6-phosphate synthase/phosphatase